MKTHRFLSAVLALAMLATLTLSGGTVLAAGNPYEPTEFVTHEGATFGRATAAYNFTTTGGDQQGQETTNTTVVSGMPLFNGKVENFDAYIGLLLKEMGDAGVITLAAGGTATGSYVNAAGQTMTYTIPGGTSTGGEALMGAAGQTELSTVMYQAQSWNKGLINDIGYLIGSENKSKLPNGGYNWTSSTGTSMTDMRLNPLSGRYDEGYGEDAVMASIFADLNARGYNGYEGDESGFYIMASVNTKHYTVYNAQWFRPITSTQVGVRSFYEYNAKSANRGWANGTFSSFMSSYGRINGVPSSASFITEWADSLGPYSVYTGTDAGADTPYLINAGGAGMAPANTYGEWSNGYDVAYSPNALYKAASMAAADHRASGGVDTLKQAIDQGINGVTVADCLNAAIAYLTIRTRVGIYDERGADGLSKFYPYNDIAANTAGKVDYTSESSQAVALRNAREGIVLLKNEGNALPIAAGANVGVYGPFAKAVNAGIYSVAVTDDYSERGAEAGNNPLESILLRDAGATFDLGLNKVTIQVAGKYLFVAADDTADGIILLKSAADYDAAADKAGYYFGILDNGQGATSIYSYGNKQWLRAIISDPTTDFDAWVGSTSPLTDTTMIPVDVPNSPITAGWFNTHKPLVVADEDCTFKQTPGTALPPMHSNYPYHFVLEPAANAGEYYIKAGAKVNGVTFVSGVAALMDKNYGFYLEAATQQVPEVTAEDGTVVSAATSYETVGLGGASMIPAFGETPNPAHNSSSGAGLAYFASLTDKTNVTFKFTEVEKAGHAAAANAAGDDCAIVFVGQSYLGLSGEGTDRMSLDLGESQIQSALNIAKTYKAAGKKTVAVVYANYPVVVEALQKSADVDAILFAGYGGQFGGRATAEVLFGEYAPTGRLVSTWYKDLALFPAVDAYSVPQATVGRDRATMDFSGGISASDIDERVTVDMTAADVVTTGLTYKYISDADSAAHVTYPFGYGLSYSSFEFSDMKVSEPVNDSFDVTVTVKNTGKVDTSEVVQVYISNPSSAYGAAAPVKSLVGFEKVALKAGATATVTISVAAQDVAIWDVNAEDYVVEPGTYTVYAAHDSSLKSALSKPVALAGTALAAFPVDTVCNIWEHSYNAANVHYDEYSKVQTAASAAAEGVNDDTFAVTAKAKGAWTVIPNVTLDKVVSAVLTAGAPAGVSGTVELRLDSPTGTKVASFSVTATGEAVKTLAANPGVEAATIKEQGYSSLTSAVAARGTHDLYVVFGAKDLRVGTLTLKTSAPVITDYTPAVPASTVFTDVTSGAWDEAPISFVVENTLFQGTAADKFSPAMKMTGTMLVTVLARQAGLDTSAGDTWDAVGVAWAKEKGVSDGITLTRDVTRQELALMLYRYAGKPAAAADLNVFTDSASVADGSVDAVKWAVANGIIGGKDGARLDPMGTATRSEVAAMVMRFANLNK